MARKPRKFSQDLIEEVVAKDLCTGCGACVISCPANALNLEGGKVVLTHEHCLGDRCGICYEQCPQLVSDEALMRILFGDEMTRSDVGFYRGAYSVRSTSPDISKVCQDGGAVTGILANLLEIGFIDAAIVTGTGDLPWLPEPRIAKSRADLLNSAGSKYSLAPLLLVLKDAEEKGYRQLAVVGTPCQIKAIRRMQTSPLKNKKIVDPVKLCVGLFCLRAFEYQPFAGELRKSLNIELADVDKLSFNGKLVVHCKDGSSHELEAKRLRKLAYPHCWACRDFTSSLADISVGGVGSPHGYSTVLIRTQAGAEAFSEAIKGGELETKPLSEVKPGMDVVEKLARKKRTIAYARISREGWRS